MRRRSLQLLVVLAPVVACGSAPSGIGAATSSGGSAGLASGGAAANGPGDAGPSGGAGGSGGPGGGANGGASAGGRVGAGGTVAAGGTPNSGGAAGAPACPGTAIGCVNDWAGQFGTMSATSQDGVGTAAVFGGNDGLRGITGDGTYVYAAGNNCIRRIEIASATVQTIAGQCGTAAYVDARGGAARFGFVDGVATNGTTLWVVDGGNFLIRAVDLATSDVTTLTGLSGSPGSTDGDTSVAQFDSMLGMTYDGSRLYISESGPNQDVRRIDPVSGAVDTIAGGNGTGAMNGAGTVAQFSGPRKLGTNGTDVFIGDTENHLVRRIVLGSGAAATHTVSTLAGSSAGYVDAAGTAAQFRRLRGITFDGTDLVVSDSDNCVIRKVAIAGGNVTTIAGAQLPGGCANHVVGVGTQAEFNKPMDIHFDAGTGDLFIAEGNVLRRMNYR